MPHAGVRPRKIIISMNQNTFFTVTSYLADKTHIEQSIVRFVIIGAVNTAFAYGLYDGLTKYKHAYESGAIFDCRCFNVPKEEVANYFYWRQKDAVRNSIEATAQANFSQKELQGKGQGELLEMLKSKGVMWFEIPLHEQRGAACLKTPGAGWSVTLNIPMFKGDEGRNFIERYIYVNE